MGLLCGVHVLLCVSASQGSNGECIIRRLCKSEIHSINQYVGEKHTKVVHLCLIITLIQSNDSNITCTLCAIDA